MHCANMGSSFQMRSLLLTHVSPIGWEHINLTGDYTGTPTAALLKVDLDPYARMKCTGAQSTRCGNRSQKNEDAD